ICEGGKRRRGEKLRPEPAPPAHREAGDGRGEESDAGQRELEVAILADDRRVPGYERDQDQAERQAEPDARANRAAEERAKGGGRAQDGAAKRCGEEDVRATGA